MTGTAGCTLGQRQGGHDNDWNSLQVNAAAHGQFFCLMTSGNAIVTVRFQERPSSNDTHHTGHAFFSSP